VVDGNLIDSIGTQHASINGIKGTRWEGVAMKLVLFALGVLAAAASGSVNAPACDLPHVPCSWDILQYDDGIAYWIMAGGGYRGVWFHPGDFYPGLQSFTITEVEFSFLWGSANHAHVGLYSASGPCPGEQLAQGTITTGSWVFDPPLTVNGDWMVVLNSMGAPEPALPSDNTPNFTGSDRSFHSADFVTWEPWVGDYLIRTHGEPNLGLQQSTWAGIKSLIQAHGSRVED
jgi:hypothetical protein